MSKALRFELVYLLQDIHGWIAMAKLSSNLGHNMQILLRLSSRHVRRVLQHGKCWTPHSLGEHVDVVRSSGSNHRLRAETLESQHGGRSICREDVDIAPAILSAVGCELQGFIVGTANRLA